MMSKEPAELEAMREESTKKTVSARSHAQDFYTQIQYRRVDEFATHACAPSYPALPSFILCFSSCCPPTGILESIIIPDSAGS